MLKIAQQTILNICLVILVATVVTACGGGDSDDEQKPVTPITLPAGVNGGALGKLIYSNYCVACHAVGAKSAATVGANTLRAIGSVGAMGNLSGHITQADADAMALYLANPAGF
jgi:mono/diheme cytochrome c family protein